MQKKSWFLFLSSLIFLFGGCSKTSETIDYRGEMRKFVREISAMGRAAHPGFLVVPQNGEALLTADGTPQTTLETDFRFAIDGFGREELFYGYDNNDDLLTPDPEHTQWLNQCTYAASQGLTILTTDYAADHAHADDARAQNASRGFLSFVADHRELDNIPAYPTLPPNANHDTIRTLADAKNFLYVISTDSWSTKEEFVNALAQAPHDVLIIDLFFEEEMLTAADLARLHQKPGGGTRLVLSYMSIGQAESYRWYWTNEMNVFPPDYLLAEDPYWTGNFYIKYWDPVWKANITGSGNSYMNRILNAGFDGVYLDLVSAYEYFEEGQ